MSNSRSHSSSSLHSPPTGIRTNTPATHATTKQTPAAVHKPAFRIGNTAIPIRVSAAARKPIEIPDRNIAATSHNPALSGSGISPPVLVSNIDTVPTQRLRATHKPTSGSYSPKCLEGAFSEGRIQDPA